MVGNKKNSRSRSSQYQQTISTPEEILHELLKIDDRQIFIKEFEEMKALVPLLKKSENQHVSILEFLKQKLAEVNLQISSADSIIKENKNFSALIDLSTLQETKKMIELEIQNILKKYKFNEENTNFNFNNDSEPNKLFNLCKSFDLRLNVTYHDGSDLPQIINLKINEATTFKDFLRDFKACLDIYEFSKFKMVLLNEKKEEIVINDMSYFSYEAENFVKIVPADY